MATPDMVLESERLRIRPLEQGDATFILRLLTEPAFLRFIGDRGVRTEDDARAYIERARESQRLLGYGLNLVEARASSRAVGICGVIKKPWLAAPDLAYALLSSAAGQGYATEAARAVMADVLARHQPSRLVAVVTPDNAASIRVLDKLGFDACGTVRDPATGETLLLYSTRTSATAHG